MPQTTPVASAPRHRTVTADSYTQDEIARAAMPFLSRIRENVRGIKSATLGTGDGIHLCSIGMSGLEDAARLAALNSSMYGVAGAQVQMMGHTEGMGIGETVVSVTMPGEILTIVSIGYPPVGNLLLCVTAEDTQLGMVILQTRDAADALATWLST